MLVTPFVDTKAFKLGIIDAQGKNLRKTSTLKTSEERDAYTYLNRLVFNMKKIINKLPGGESKLKSIIAALFLVKEYYESGDKTTSLMEEKYLRILDKVNQGVSLVEEEILVTRFLENPILEDGVVANVTGGQVATDVPAPLKKNVKKYKQIVRRASPVKA
jgi:hypothetical protein